MTVLKVQLNGVPRVTSSIPSTLGDISYLHFFWYPLLAIFCELTIDDTITNLMDMGAYCLSGAGIGFIEFTLTENNRQLLVLKRMETVYIV